MVVVLWCLCALVIPALAADVSDFEYLTADGTTAIDYDRYWCAVAEELILSSGVDLDADDYWLYDEANGYSYDYTAFEADYLAASRVDQAQEESTEAVNDQASEEIEQPLESGENENDTSTSSTDDLEMDSSTDSKYPLGSYVDPLGNVYSPDGELLSSGSTAVPYVVAEDTTENVEVTEEPEPHVFNVVDLRSSTSSVSTYSTSAVAENSYTNQIPISKLPNGVVYGYKSGYYYSITDQKEIFNGSAKCNLTGFIPLTNTDDIIRIKNISFEHQNS